MSTSVTHSLHKPCDTETTTIPSTNHSFRNNLHETTIPLLETNQRSNQTRFYLPVHSLPIHPFRHTPFETSPVSFPIPSHTTVVTSEAPPPLRSRPDRPFPDDRSPPDRSVH